MPQPAAPAPEAAAPAPTIVAAPPAVPAPQPAAVAPAPPPAAPVLDEVPRQAPARAAYDGPPPMDDIPPPEFDGYMPAQDESQSYAPPARERFVASHTPAPVAPAVVPADAPSAGGSDGPLDGRALNDAWKSVMADGAAIPAPLRMVLKAVTRVSPEFGTVVVPVSPSTLGMEQVTSATSRRALEEALAQRLGRRVTVKYVATQGTVSNGGGAPGPARITSESARRDRLQRMMEGEPVLAAAVQAWDLELVD